MADNTAKSLRKILVMGCLEGGERPFKDLSVFDTQGTDFIHLRPCLFIGVEKMEEKFSSKLKLMIFLIIFF